MNIIKYPSFPLDTLCGGFCLTYETSWSLQYFISLEWKQFLTGISKSDLNNKQIQHSNKHLVTFFKFSSWNKVVPISQNLSYGKNSKTSSKNSRWPFVSCRLNTVCPGDESLLENPVKNCFHSKLMKYWSDHDVLYVKQNPPHRGLSG